MGRPAVIEGLQIPLGEIRIEVTGPDGTRLVNAIAERREGDGIEIVGLAEGEQDLSEGECVSAILIGPAGDAHRLELVYSMMGAGSAEA